MSADDDPCRPPGTSDDWETRCAYIVGYGGDGLSSPVICGGPLQPRSPYCPHHHALCHAGRGSAAEQRRLRETEALAAAVAGRRSRDVREPLPTMLRDLERRARQFIYPKCS